MTFCHVYFSRSDVTKIPVQFGYVEKYFTCADCKQLTSLKGSPREVRGYYECMGCVSLKTLEGSPRKVGEDFDCFRCTSIKNMKGAPEHIGTSLLCYDCEVLERMEGSPEKIGFNLDMASNDSLKSIVMAPYEFKFIDCQGCKNLPEKELEMVTGDVELLKKWIKSRLPVEVFMHNNRGLISSKDVLG